MLTLRCMVANRLVLITFLIFTFSAAAGVRVLHSDSINIGNALLFAFFLIATIISAILWILPLHWTKRYYRYYRKILSARNVCEPPKARYHPCVTTGYRLACIDHLRTTKNNPR